VNCMPTKKKSYRYHPHVVPCMRINKSHDNSLVGVRLHINTAHQITWVDTADEDDREALSLPRPKDWQNGNVEMKTLYRTGAQSKQHQRSVSLLHPNVAFSSDAATDSIGAMNGEGTVLLLLYSRYSSMQYLFFAWLRDQGKHHHQ
jgi:hypothetical protein